MATLQSNMSLPWTSADENNWRQYASSYAQHSTEQKALGNSRFSPFSSCDSTPELVADEPNDSVESLPGSPGSFASQGDEVNVQVEDVDLDSTSISEVTKSERESIPKFELDQDWSGKEWDQRRRSLSESSSLSDLNVRTVAKYAIRMKNTKTGKVQTVMVNLHNKKDVALARLESTMC